jgi:hypothetical protein
MAGANDGVSLPVAEPALASHDFWSLLNAGTVGDLTAPDVSAITLPLLLLTAQMAMQRAPVPLVGIDIEVDPFMTDSGPLCSFKVPGNLLWTPVLA